MTKLLAKNEVQAHLAAKREEIDLRLQGLQHELATTGEAVKAAVLEHPFVGASSSLAAGLVAGLVFGGRRKKKGKDHDRPDVPKAHRALVENYLDAVARDAHEAAERGEDATSAIRRALEGRVPVVVHGAAGQGEEGALKQGLDLAIKTALGFAVRSGLDYATTRLGLTPPEPHAYADSDDEGEGAGTVAAVVSEEA